MNVQYIGLSNNQQRLRGDEWRLWKKMGYRVLADDGITVYHEREAIRMSVLEAFANIDADIFLFGSQVTGKAHAKSDYDVGYYAEEKVPIHIIVDLKEKLEDMPIPASVDLVDFAATSEDFRLVALKGGVEIWKHKQKNSLFSPQD